MATFYLLLVIIVILQCTRMGNPTTTTGTTLGYYELMKANRMEKLRYKYYPNYGYEPYWIDGEWVLNSTTAKPGQTTTRQVKACGEPCSHLFRGIKHVCGRQSGDENHAPSACGVSMFSLKCSGYPGDDFSSGYKTFNTYCEFLGAQCRAKFYEQTRWVLVNVGKCKPLDDYFKPLWWKQQPISRMNWYLSSLGPEPTTPTTKTIKTTT